jgi:hypothetical protein
VQVVTRRATQRLRHPVFSPFFSRVIADLIASAAFCRA